MIQRVCLAWKLCPDAVYLRPQFELYVRASNNITNILKIHADKFEQGGIDEAYLDISNRVKDFDEAGKVARKILEDVLKKEGLTCSVGIGPNKMIAKIAS
ncbi:MAG: DNA polymerase IV, partial [Erysipelotrichaceae bacterium]|nr:DNA polymerase IV [Erysipelotrichaceae bacterium]